MPPPVTRHPLFVTGIAGLVMGLLAIGCAPAEHPPAAPDVRLEDATSAWGLDFTYRNGMTGRMTFVEITGGGVATLDFDLDGDPDLYFSQGQRIGGAPDPALGDRLFRNDSPGPGRLRFTDVTAESRITAPGYGMGVAVGHINQDDFPDLYVTNWGANQLWLNNGDGTFTDVTTPEVADPRWSVSAAFADLDADGFEDLIVVNYVDYSLDNDHPCTSALSGRPDYCGPMAYPPTADRLLRNRGDGTFEDVTLPAGLAGARGAGLGVAVLDANGDGLLDLYVANDGSDNRLWMNRTPPGGPLRFVDEAVLRGAAVNMRGLPEASMGVVVDDFDGDLAPDLLLTHLNGETNTLYRNDGQGFFTDATRSSGLGPPGIPHTGFGVLTRDFDRDGFLDLFVANGDVRILPEQAQDPLPLKQVNQLLVGSPGGFVEAPFDPVREVSRGAASADFDRDGLPDIVVSNIEGPARVYRNVSLVSDDWAGVVLQGPGISGARVGLKQAGPCEGERPQPSPHRTAACALLDRSGSYASSNQPERVFPIEHRAAPHVTVTWIDGHSTTVPARAGGYVTVRREQ